MKNLQKSKKMQLDMYVACVPFEIGGDRWFLCCGSDECAKDRWFLCCGSDECAKYLFLRCTAIPLTKAFRC